MVKTRTVDYDTFTNTNILQLPADCLLLILNYISLREVLACREVCQQWLIAVHKFGKGLHTLRLFHNFFPVPDCRKYFKTLYHANLQDNPEFAFSRFNTLALKPIITKSGSNSSAAHFRQLRNGKMAYGGRFLAKLFPNVHNLVLSFEFEHGRQCGPHFNMDHAYLLREWRHSLQSLTIFGQPKYLRAGQSKQKQVRAPVKAQSEHQKSIYGALNACSNLKRLHLLNFNENYDYFDLDQCPALHAQLEAYSWSNGGGFRPIQKSQLTAVKCLRGSDPLKDLNCEMFQNVTELSFNWRRNWRKQYTVRFCSYFTNLVCLDISSCQNSVEDTNETILSDLSTLAAVKLPKLVHLKLSARLVWSDVNGFTRQQLCTIPKLHSISTLHLVDSQTVLLKGFKPVHYEFLADKFPSVSVIHISCSITLYVPKVQAKMRTSFERHFGANRLSEIKFFNFTRWLDMIQKSGKICI